jgi:hypothetical protein
LAIQPFALRLDKGERMTPATKRRRGRPETEPKPDPDLPDPKRLDRLRFKAAALVEREIVATKRQANRDAREMAASAAEPDPITRDNYGATEQQITNGRVRLGVLRPDPARPMRDANGVQVGWHETKGARAYVAYEALPLTAGQLAAARRIHDACEAITGAREFNGGGLGGRAFWQVGGPSAAMVEAAADLRAVACILGRAHERAVLLLVVNGDVGDLDVLRGALETMAAYWGV